MNALALLLKDLAASGFSMFNEMFSATSRYALSVSRLIPNRFLVERGGLLLAGSYKTIFCSTEEVKKVRKF